MPLSTLGVMRARFMLPSAYMHGCLLMVHGRRFAFFCCLRVMLLDCV